MLSGASTHLGTPYTWDTASALPSRPWPPTAGEVDPSPAVLRAGAGRGGGSPGPCGSPERVPDPAWEMGEGRGGGRRPGEGGGRAGESLRVDMRCSGPGVYQPAAERGPARLGTSGFGLAGSRWASRERKGLGGPPWARRSGGLDFILGRGLLTSSCWEGLQGLSGAASLPSLAPHPAAGGGTWQGALAQACPDPLPATQPGLRAHSRG